MAKLRIGAIGVGGMGRGHFLAAAGNGRVKIVAACDINPGVLEEIDDRKIAKYTKWDALLENETLDLVILCLPHYLYGPVVCEALKRGIHVYKDKPFARDLRDARAMVAAAKRYGRRIFVGAQSKFSPCFIRAKKIVERGDLGKIHFVRGTIHYYWTPVFTNTMRWRGQPEKSGGIAIIDSGYHIIDAITALKGKPRSVFASTGKLRAVPNARYRIDDKAALVLDYRDGALGAVTISFATVPGEFRVVLHGQEGTLDVRRESLDIYRGAELVEHMDVDSQKVDLLKEQFAHCIRALERNEPSLCDMERALDVQRIIDAAYRSNSTGQRVTIR